MNFNNGCIQFAFQTGKDQIAATPDYFLRVLSGTSIGPDREVQTKRTSECTRSSDGISVVGAMGSGGTVNFVCQPKNLPAVLASAMGKIATTGAADPYSHVVSPTATGGIPWLTGFVTIDTINMIIPNLKVNSLKLIVSSADRLVVGTMELIGAGAVKYKTSKTGVLGPEGVERIYSWDMAKGKWKLDGNIVGYIHTLEVDVNNNLTAIPGEDYFPYDVQEGPMEVDYAPTITIINASDYNYQIWGEESPTDGAEPKSEIQIGSFSTEFVGAKEDGKDRDFEVDFKASEYRNPLPKLAIDPDGRPQDLRLEARVTGAATNAEFKVTNGVSAYALPGS